ncbi:glycosyltransferase [Acidomonas methanolica]|uniref:Glycosyl transferase n=1 Tax=Acidomonas methanolica NBRC 104435 TaxID=1231351 RepID=A0A023D5B3_ACIMT|nr:glycosyltransferase [Acidomonas methanolica]TCS32187.1 glycosyltransferase involved in cell wall biosynthesis [Acidomonas methanolica]GAJ28991.1 glycosyl transferase [Acidomonas methanolica NBRC 104435]GBQ52269.1 glycosyltransferase [Acidomonas methanolica]GEK97621.1 glycosyl transferase [Acidomonas methanolica NBRC 104435]
MAFLSDSGTPLRVAHVMAGAPTGGAELFFERLTRAQHAGGVDVAAFIRRDAGRVERLRDGGVPVRTFRFGGALDWRTRPRLARALRGFAPNVVVAWMSRAARHLPEGNWTAVGRLGGYYDLSNYRGCRHLVGNTRGLVAWMIAQGWSAEQVHYVPNFASDYADVSACRPPFLHARRPFVLALGRLHRNKAFDTAIHAVRTLPDLDLVIAGDGPERESLAALARRLGVAERVHFPGWVQNAAPWLKACDALICPSRIEPLGNVVIEAFSAGRPVVAADLQGPRELIAGTEDGLLFPVEDHDALAAELSRILDDPALAARLGSNGRARFEREFAAPTVLARWEHFLRVEAV